MLGFKIFFSAKTCLEHTGLELRYLLPLPLDPGLKLFSFLPQGELVRGATWEVLRLWADGKQAQGRHSLVDRS